MRSVLTVTKMVYFTNPSLYLHLCHHYLSSKLQLFLFGGQQSLCHRGFAFSRGGCKISCPTYALLESCCLLINRGTPSPLHLNLCGFVTCLEQQNTVEGTLYGFQSWIIKSDSASACLLKHSHHTLSPEPRC